MKNQQKRLKENAKKEEQKRKEKEDHIIGFLNKLSGEVEKVKAEIQQPDKNQKQETFRAEEKFALIITNKTYNRDKTTMKDLPSVDDDHRNIR